jgi:biopolymer transport protein TolQ
VSTDLSLFAMFLNASLTVQLVMVLLLVASLVSWTVILRKHRDLETAISDADRFEGRFWSGGDLASMYKELEESEVAAGGMETIFESGFSEFLRQRKRDGVRPDRVLDAVRRGMRISQMREVDGLERNLAFLATVGSTSPYVGLFGTVWGIMNSFRALGNVQHATLQMVAPGIAEALIATAMGLFAAIPAVIAYNRFADRVERLERRYDTFAEEFISIVERHTQTSATGAQASTDGSSQDLAGD